jgi:glutamate synthase domain-containing protein 3
MRTIDLAVTPLRELNSELHRQAEGTNETDWEVLNPRGQHAVAVGVDAPIKVAVRGPVGYYGGGMNKKATITIHGSAGPGVAENMMSGSVVVKGDASQYAGATGRGGLLVIEGNAASRCGISMKGIDIVVGGSVGDFAAFMAQAGRLVVCGDAGDGLGDSLYEAVIYVRGRIASFGADAHEEPMTEADYAAVKSLLDAVGFDHDPKAFRRVASKRELYHWNADAKLEY